MDQSHDSSSEYDSYDDDPQLKLEDVERSKTINFSIRASYTNWKPREAFRELVQNWRDGIIRSFHLREEQFTVIREERTSGRTTEIVYKVPRFGGGDEKEWLGYVRFAGRGGEGTVEVTNRAATLQPRHLDLGGTSKAGDTQQAGAHGEGLKIALLVLMRGGQNHAVRCRSGGFNWRFDFTAAGRLVARLRRMTPEAVRKAEEQARRQADKSLLPFAADPRSVVQFVIGERRKGRNEWGGKVGRDAVSRREFDEWTRAALFLHDTPEGGVVSTPDGDLLTHRELCGSIYLKGLLLAESAPGRSASISRLPLRFGYNFATGSTNRERQSVASADEESRAVLAIWGRVVAVKPTMAKELSEMLNTDGPGYADVYGARRKMGFETASVLRRYLLWEDFADRWYYCAEEESKNPRLEHIIQGLGRKPCQLTKTYWDILRGHNLLRTAEEEENHLFTAAPYIDVPQAPFPSSVHRLLRACARACPRTAGIGIRFVAAERLHLQLFYSEADREFRVHRRWLTPAGAAGELGLDEGLAEDDLVFHAVKRLFAEALDQLPQRAFLEGEDGSRTVESRRRQDASRAEQRVLEYLRFGEFTARGTLVFERFSELTVGGDPEGTPQLVLCRNYTPWGDDAEVEVQCHQARCPRIQDVLIAEDVRLEKMACISPAEQGARPTCYSRRYTRWEGSHYQAGLEEEREYVFVIAASSHPNSIVKVSEPCAAFTFPPPPATPPSPDSPPLALPELEASVSPDKPAACPKTPLKKNGVSTDKTPAPKAKDTPGDKAKPNGGQSSTSAPGTTKKPAEAPKVAPDTGVKQKATNGAQSSKQVPGTTSTPAGTSAATAEAATPPGLFAPDSPLQSLDILDVDRDGWYKAKTSDNVQAVLGIFRGQQYPPPGESRKRQRIDDS